ncbi:hypothetical protein PCANC_10326 [Puccinia coronata f. sp. avenae]|uniref:Uncharacterized protein n=1 Tax=Puccinia coronata f. sp. avenae TaxID=200324 RepID=A0A2N5SXJ5_9BASI|nr:hypothetical protein PCANC_10326 [Puccinia coronata f. sp. avenae]
MILKLVQCQLVGSSAIPTSWYSASSPGGSPNKLVLHPGELPASWYCTSSPGELPASWYCTSSPGELPASWYCTSSPGELSASCYSASSPGARLSRRAGIVPDCQEALPTSWYCTSFPGELPKSWYCTSSPGKLPSRSDMNDFFRQKSIPNSHLTQTHHRFQSLFSSTLSNSNWLSYHSITTRICSPEQQIHQFDALPSTF